MSFVEAIFLYYNKLRKSTMAELKMEFIMFMIEWAVEKYLAVPINKKATRNIIGSFT